ncbi:sugar ABC transporter substrate-binding protein [Amycolatopsis sp. WAC 01375]|uniref:FecCD family ABC transporter permease n=1 Tax=unclassified Amycolatopsis TaxID=2618356 RepID=UPI000F7B6DAD|nr:MULTISPECIES: iron ABC transporter permease [unclassified Amycolatopsis]RSM72048.1 sugar ABC transporter substrate-binding protein [Amycolatopsis sp. WAC 01375]RSN32140.1 sugar ABC transporter substrate-binding protein [Amycolatopsis sp. WAC 01416]
MVNVPAEPLRLFAEPDDAGPDEKAARSLRLTAPVLLLSAALVISLIAGIALGPSSVALPDVLRYLGKAITGGTITGDEVTGYSIVWQVRTPRVLLAAVVGAGLAVVGVAVQALVRNALADPFVLGISSGASVGAAAVVVFGLFAGLGVLALSTAAFLGALGATAIVYLAARSKFGLTPLRLVLTGVALTYGFQAVMSVLVYLSPSGQAAQTVLFWLLGSLGAATWASLPLAALGVAVAIVVLLRYGTALDVLSMGDETAMSLGTDAAALRRWLFLLTAVVTGLLVAVSGSIGFVGLVLPHVVRMIAGSGHRRVLALAPLVGAVFLVWVDLLARTLVAPEELPLGVITALIGVPVFLVVMRRRGYAFGGR